MGSSYEHQIVEAMLERSAALEAGDENRAAEALVRAGQAADKLRTRRRGAFPRLRSER